MNRVKKLLALRKQDDLVKLALLLFLAAGWFLYTACAQGINYARIQTQPIEYVAESSFSGAVLEQKLQKLQNAEGVAGVSRQREILLTAGEKVLHVTELERKYLTDCCGIEISGTDRRYWLSREAFSGLFGGISSPGRLTYQREEKTESGEFLLFPGFSEEDDFAVTLGSTVTLGDSQTLRVMFEHGDPSGADIRKLEGLGFTVLNQTEMQRRSFEAELALTKFLYAALAALFALAAGTGFLKCSAERRKRKQRIE